MVLGLWDILLIFIDVDLVYKFFINSKCFFFFIFRSVIVIYFLEVGILY